MSGRGAGLVLLALCELLAGLGLRNEALAARSRAEQYNRSWIRYQGYTAHYEHLQYAMMTPNAIEQRLIIEQERKRREQEPEL